VECLPRRAPPSVNARSLPAARGTALMADRRVEHLIVGAGIAGATCARTLREQGATGSVMVVGRELDAPYHRPPISKGYLRGEQSRDDALVLPAGWWEANDVELRTRTSVMSLNIEAHTAKLSTKEEIEFGHALLATGAMVRRLTVEGSDLDGLHYLRALGNADALRRDLEQAERVVLIGGSYIGCEVAASLTELGRRCTIVMQETVTLERHFGVQVGAFFQGVLEEHGIEVVAGEEVRRLEGVAPPGGEGPGRVAAVLTAGGAELAADVVVLGVGALPDVMLARRSGLELGQLGGVLADSRLRSSAADVYVAGDMCEYDSVVHGRRLRIEHEDVAASQGATAAQNMLGADRPHDVVPYFFSDLSDWISLEYVGPAETWDRELVRGRMQEGSFSVWYLQGRRVAGALAVARPGDLDHARRLILAGRKLDDDGLRRLADPDSDLASVGGT